MRSPAAPLLRLCCDLLLLLTAPLGFRTPVNLDHLLHYLPGLLGISLYNPPRVPLLLLDSPLSSVVLILIACAFIATCIVSHPEPGLLPSPCFPNFLARTTFVLVSLSEVKIPGQDAIFGDFVFNSSKMQERGGKG